MKRTFSFFAAFFVFRLNGGSITTDPTTSLVIHRIIKDGPNVPKFNQIVSEYFHTVFGSGGDKYLDDFPTVDIAGITDREISGYISNEIDSVISHYGSGSIFSALKHAVSARSPDKPRFRIHLLLGLLRFSNLEIADKKQVLERCILYAKENKEEKHEIDKRQFHHVQDMIKRMNEQFGGPRGVEISAMYLKLIDQLTRSTGVLGGVSELFDPYYAISWGKKQANNTRFLGAVFAAAKLCSNEHISRKWTIKPIVCDEDLGGKFLLDILTNIAALNGDENNSVQQLIRADMPIWYVFNPDFVLNRLAAAPGPNIRWTLSALLEIFKSNLGNFASIARNKESFVVQLFVDFVPRTRVGDYGNEPLESGKVAELETSLGTPTKVSIVCAEATKWKISFITNDPHCQQFNK